MCRRVEGQWRQRPWRVGHAVMRRFGQRSAQPGARDRAGQPVVQADRDSAQSQWDSRLGEPDRASRVKMIASASSATGAAALVALQLAPAPKWVARR